MAGEASTTESAKAKEAFAQYVALGPGRSLRKLADLMVQQGLYKSSTVALRSLADWSSQHNWQDRIGNAATERSEAMLKEAAELDADTFLVTSRLLNERVKMTMAVDTDHVVKVRESVRKAVPKGGASVSVNVSVEVQRMIERIAAEDGLDEAEKRELFEAVERHLTGAS